MSDSKPPANSYDRERQEIRARLLAIYQKTGERCDIAAAYELRKSEDPMTYDEHRHQKYLAIKNPAKNPPHRPKSKDDLLLLEVVLLMALKKWPVSKAALFVAEKTPGQQSVSATAARLRRKYREKMATVKNLRTDYLRGPIPTVQDLKSNAEKK